MGAVELDRWMDHDVTAWARRWGVPALRIFRRVGSTNDVARELAEAGAPEGTLVIADEQTRGRGRRGRAWVAPAGSSLSMSMVVRPGSHAASGILTLRLGLAAARGLDPLLAAPLGLKWPNDLEIEGRKVGGILCESVAAERGVAYVVAGIGLNLRRPDDGWAPHIAGRATSLAEAATTTIDAPSVVQRVTRPWLAVAAEPADTLSAVERAEFQRRDVLRGRDVAVDDRPAGVAAGVTAAGTLRVRQPAGTAEVMAGSVRAIHPFPGERA